MTPVSVYNCLFYVDWTKGHWLLNQKHLHHPAHFPPGRPKGCVITVPVEEFLQHPDSAAGAQTAHDDERKQPALPTTWGPGVQQLKFLLLFITLSHTHIHAHTHTHIHACLHACILHKTLCSHFLLRKPSIGRREGWAGEPRSWPGAQSFFEVPNADQTLQNKNTVHLTIMLFFMIFVFYIQIVKWLECTNYVCFLGFSHVVTVSPWCLGILSHFSIQSTSVPTNIFKVPSYCW